MRLQLEIFFNSCKLFHVGPMRRTDSSYLHNSSRFKPSRLLKLIWLLLNLLIELQGLSLTESVRPGNLRGQNITTTSKGSLWILKRCQREHVLIMCLNLAFLCNVTVHIILFVIFPFCSVSCYCLLLVTYLVMVIFMIFDLGMCLLLLPLFLVALTPL